MTNNRSEMTKYARWQADVATRVDVIRPLRAKTSAHLACTLFGYASLCAGFEPGAPRRLEWFRFVTKPAQSVSRSSECPHYRHISETPPTGVGCQYPCLFVTPIGSYTEIPFVSGQPMAQTRRIGTHNKKAT